MTTFSLPIVMKETKNALCNSLLIFCKPIQSCRSSWIILTLFRPWVEGTFKGITSFDFLKASEKFGDYQFLNNLKLLKENVLFRKRKYEIFVAVALLRTFALIVCAHPYCARNSHGTSCIERALSRTTIIEQSNFHNFSAFNNNN